MTALGSEVRSPASGSCLGAQHRAPASVCDGERQRRESVSRPFQAAPNDRGDVWPPKREGSLANSVSLQSAGFRTDSAYRPLNRPEYIGAAESASNNFLKQGVWPLPPRAAMMPGECCQIGTSSLFEALIPWRAR